jgi:type II secretory pathway pseudopilin PulG
MTSERRHPAAGFTILELLLVLGVVGSLTVALAMGIRRVRNSDLRADTAKIAQALRAANIMATQTGVHHRVVFNLDEQSFRIERCQGLVTLHQGRNGPKSPKDGDDVSKSKLEEAMRLLQGGGGGSAAGGVDLGAAFGGGFGGLPSIINSIGGAGVGGPGTGGQTSELISGIHDAATPHDAVQKARALVGARIGGGECGPPMKQRSGTESKDPRGEPQKVQTWNEIGIKRVHVQHLEDPAEEGEVSVNFFPLGYSEKAVVEVASSDGDRYTLLVHGLTGRVEFKDGAWRSVDSHMLRDGTGGRVEER